MVKHAWIVVLVAASLAWPGRASAQTTSPEAIAAAKELMVASKMSDQISLMLPHIMQQLKPLIARGNAKLEADFDALMPIMMQGMSAQLDKFLDQGAQIYAKHFTADEIRQVTNFYRSPAGEKFLRKQPEVVQETMALGQQFGPAIAKDIQARIIEELRKRGHKI